MTFGRPGWLALLGVLALLALAFWWGRRRPVIVPHLPLWREAVRRTVVRHPVSRWRRRFSRWLKGGAAVLAVLAAAGPEWRVVVPGRGRAFLLVDVSASMASREGEASRLTRAIDLVARVLDDEAVSNTSWIPVEVYGGIARVLGPALPRGKVLEVLRSLTPRPLRDGLGAAVETLRASHPSEPLLIFSDFCGAEILATPPEGVYAYPVGTKSGNGAVLDAEIVDDPVTGRVRLALKLGAFGPRPLERTLLVRWDGRILHRLPMTLAPEAEIEVTRSWDLEEGGLLEVELAPGDALEMDDVASFVVADRARLIVDRLARDAQGDERLTLALASLDPLVSRARMTSDLQGAGSGVGGEVKVVILEGGTLQRPLLPGRYLLLGTSGTGLPVPGEDPGPGAIEVSGMDEAHPMMSGLAFDELMVDFAWRLRPRSGQRVLLGSKERPLIVSGHEEGVRFVQTAFSLDRSNLAYLPSFPLWLKNALLWLEGRRPELEAGYRAGRPILPRSRVSVRPREAAGSFVLEGGVWWPLATGVFSFVVGDHEERAAVNFFDASESRIEPPAGAGRRWPGPPPETKWRDGTLVMTWAAVVALWLGVSLRIGG